MEWKCNFAFFSFAPSIGITNEHAITKKRKKTDLKRKYDIITKKKWPFIPMHCLPMQAVINHLWFFSYISRTAVLHQYMNKHELAIALRHVAVQAWEMTDVLFMCCMCLCVLFPSLLLVIIFVLSRLNLSAGAVITRHFSLFLRLAWCLQMCKVCFVKLIIIGLLVYYYYYLGNLFKWVIRF